MKFAMLRTIMSEKICNVHHAIQELITTIVHLPVMIVLLVNLMHILVNPAVNGVKLENINNMLDQLHAYHAQLESTKLLNRI